MIDVRNIVVAKQGKTIVDRVSLQIRPGKISVLIGKNGAGKSTLLEALTGAHPVSAGRISWDDAPLSQINPENLAMRRAVLAQTVGPAFPIRIYDLVETGSYAYRGPLSGADKRRRIEQALDEVEMRGFQNRMFHTLSGGEQKRVLLAKCTLQLDCTRREGTHQYLFLDEPTSSLDIHQQFKLMELIRRLVHKQRVGVFAILHDVNLAALFADEILLMQAGAILAKGRPENVLTPALIEKALGVRAVIRPHPVFGRPHVTTFPVFEISTAGSTFFNQ